MFRCEGRPDRRTEQDVLGHRHVGVVAGGIERLHQALVLTVGQVLPHPLARHQARGGEPRMLCRIDALTQTQPEHVVFQVDHIQGANGEADQRFGVVGAGGVAIDPLGARIRQRVAAAQRFLLALLVEEQGPPLVGARLHRLAAERIVEVVADGADDEGDILADEGDPAAGHRLGERGQRAVAEADGAGGGPDQAGEQAGKIIGARAAAADQRHLLPQLETERDPVHQLQPALVVEAEGLGDDRGAEMRHRALRGAWRDSSRRPLGTNCSINWSYLTRASSFD